MKNFVKLLLVVVVAFGATQSLSAASSKSRSNSNVVTRSYHADLHCEECVKKVMNTLPYQKGVKDVDVSLRDKRVTVKYDKRKCSDDAVIRSLTKLDICSGVERGDGVRTNLSNISSKSSHH